jgi:acyl carrier protein
MNHPNEEEISDWLITKLSEILKIKPDQIDVNEAFASYGLTSVNAVALTGDLEDWLGRPLTATLAYNYPNISALARHLADGVASKLRSAQ